LCGLRSGVHVGKENWLGVVKKQKVGSVQGAGGERGKRTC